MKKFLYTFFVLAALEGKAQIELIQLGGSLLKKAGTSIGKNKIYNDEKDISFQVIGTDTLFYKRTPVEKAQKSPAYPEIQEVEKRLEVNRQAILAGKEVVEMNFLYLRLDHIAKMDSKWNIIPYSHERDFYQHALKRQKEIRLQAAAESQRRLDSLEKVRHRETLVLDSTARVEYARKLRAADSLAIEERRQAKRYAGYMYVDGDEAKLRIAPGEKSISKVLVYGGSEVKVVDRSNPKWFKVHLSDYEGYLSTDVLKDRISSLKNEKAKAAALDFEQAGGGLSLLADSDAYKMKIPSLKEIAPSRKNISNGQKYHRGPKGGCFYYSSSGKKVYVDRSLCN